MTENSWHRRHAVQIAAALPDDPEEALLVLRLAEHLVRTFLAKPEAYAPVEAKVIRIMRD